jgi:hypothetical protein
MILRLSGRRLRRIRALARRARWELDDQVRIRLFGANPGFALRPPSGPQVSVEGRSATMPRLRVTAVDRGRRRTGERGAACVGLLDGHGGERSPGGSGSGTAAAAAAAALLGLRPVAPPLHDWRRTIEEANAEAWPLLVLSLGDPVPDTALEPLGRFVSRGGTLLLVPQPGTVPDLEPISRAFGCPLPQPVMRREPGRWLRVATALPEVTAGFTGIAVEAPGLTRCLRRVEGAIPLASIDGPALAPVLTLSRLGEGWVAVSAVPANLRGPLRASLGPEHWTALVPALLLMRWLYDELTWRPPAVLANFTIDDPALAGGRLGLDYRNLVRRAEAGRFHVTVATIPRELDLADPGVLSLLRTRSDALSACYHGWAHRGYEFFLPDAGRARFPGRPLDVQQEAVARAAAAGRELWRRSGTALDRVMVFPHGVGPAATLPALPRHGFLGSCNYDDRDPLGAPPPDEPDLGLRPADTAWSGVPLLWRRGLSDPRFLVDLLLGRPLLSFGHRRKLGPDLLPFAEQAARIRAQSPDVRWCGLETVALHAYQTRLDPQRGWQVLMTADEICLHNPGRTARRYTVRRSYLAGGCRLHMPASSLGPHLEPPAGGDESARNATPDDAELVVEVPAGGAVRVCVEGAARARLPRPASVCWLDAEPRPGAAQFAGGEPTPASAHLGRMGSGSS